MDQKLRSDAASSNPAWVTVVEEHADHGITVEPHGVERGDRRTALSQRRNLYFVAYSSRIHVYQPSRGQMIGSRPALILTPKMARPDAPGYIAPNIPHAINQITVGDLGSDEILLLATDSGNVAAYRTEHIYLAIEGRRVEDTDPIQLGNGVACFFSEWVTQSAWALAIHKFARMIAVSSNTTTITIFAFALVEDTDAAYTAQGNTSSSAANPKVYNNDWIHIASLSEFMKLRSWSRQRRRAQNIRLSLLGHAANIPNVSFLNCDLDPHGDWLVSTDINNKLLVWKIWERFRPVNHWDFYPAEDQHYDDLFDDSRQRGWNVLALDPRSFRMKKDLFEACGGPPHRFPDKKAPYDLSFLAGRVHDATQYYDFFSPRPPANEYQSQGPPPDELFPLTHSDGSDGDSGELSGHREPATPTTSPLVYEGTERQNAGPSTPGVQGAPESASSLYAYHHAAHQTASTDLVNDNNNLSDSGDEDIEIDYGEDDDEDDNEEDEYEGDENEDDTHVQGTHSDDAVVDNADINMDPNDDDTDNASSENSSESGVQSGIVVPQPVSPIDEDTNSESDGLDNPNDTGRLLAEDHPDFDLFSDFPILHFSEAHIRMLPGPFSYGPSVIFRAALSQVVTNPVQFIEATDRFNMALQIPDLGIVVAASQKGRVAVLGLTEVPNEGKVFRMDRILPFASQERNRLRPLCPLLGIAASPVAPHLIPPESPSDDYEDAYPRRYNFDVHKSNNHSSSSSQRGTSAHSHRAEGEPGKSCLRGKHCTYVPFNGGPRKEKWHGIEYSRRYRLFLTYCDHTILHYELYYDWPKELRGPEAQMAYHKDEPFILRP
ncbi:hypothetical protein MferCBS49748_001080 [Microsporum ferrugineum]